MEQPLDININGKEEEHGQVISAIDSFIGSTLKEAMGKCNSKGYESFVSSYLDGSVIWAAFIIKSIQEG